MVFVELVASNKDTHRDAPWRLPRRRYCRPHRAYCQW